MAWIICAPVRYARGQRLSVFVSLGYGTTTANKVMAPVHHHMPLMLSSERWDEWLYPGPLRPGRLAELLAPAPVDLLGVFPVGSAVNKAGNDRPELVDPVPLSAPARS